MKPLQGGAVPLNISIKMFSVPKRRSRLGGSTKVERTAPPVR